MAAAAGCQVFVDERFDTPTELGAVALPNRLNAWQKALQKAIADFPATLEHAKRTRAAALALPSVETVPPPWDVEFPAAEQHAAEQHAAE
jgi:hypothetical protein